MKGAKYHSSDAFPASEILTLFLFRFVGLREKMALQEQIVEEIHESDNEVELIAEENE